MILTLSTALVAFVVMLLGERWRVGGRRLARDAPISQAVGIALAMTTAWPATPSTWAAEQPFRLLPGLLGPAALGLLAVLLVAAWRRSATGLAWELGRCLTSIGVAGVLARLPGVGGATVFGSVRSSEVHAGLVALLLLLVAAAAVAAPFLLRAVLGAWRDGTTFRSRVAVDAQRDGLLALATATTAVVVAISLPVLGPLAVALFIMPMVVLLPAHSVESEIRAAQRETIVALAGLTDQAGLTAPGHAVRVAALAVPVARDAGVADADLEDVERVALLHDVGQVGLSTPIPAGATVEISPRDQRRVATTGAAVLGRTAQLSRVAPLVADVGVPHHRAEERGDVSLASRVVRVVSAYDDLCGQGVRLNGASGAGPAVERLVRAVPREYDPVVVRALIRQLERRGDLEGPDASRLRAALVDHEEPT